MKKRTKIVCTIGPSCESVKVLKGLINAGMNIARLNFSHGTRTNHEKLIKNIKKAEKEAGRPVAILQDIQGPKIRIGLMPEQGVELKDGSSVIFDTSIDKYNKKAIPIDYKSLHEFLKQGERIFLNDGKFEVLVEKVEGTKIYAKVVNGGVITSHKGINVPDSALNVRVLTDKDIEDVKFGVEKGVDLIALSFVMRPEDILDLRYVIKKHEKSLKAKNDRPIGIIAKIERNEAVKNIREILNVADGIMVARGDLGVEIPAREVPLVQKKLIDEAIGAAKPVIVATQMLDSMQFNPRPTRAEVSDVANAVIDHTDAVMLSNETSTGKFPVETVSTMSDIVIEAEKSVYAEMPVRELKGKLQPIDEIISQMSRPLAEKTGAKLILAASISGETGRLISRNRPELPIVVATSSERVLRQLNLSWGVYPIILEQCSTIEELVERAIVSLKKKKLVVAGDKIIVVAGEPVGYAGHVNLLEVKDIT